MDKIVKANRQDLNAEASIQTNKIDEAIEKEVDSEIEFENAQINSTPTKSNPKIDSISTYFPWVSIIGSILFFTVIFFNKVKQLETAYELLPIIQSIEQYYMLFTLLIIVYAFDYTLYYKRKVAIKLAFNEYHEKLTLAWKHKAKQQARANTFSGQTDKLKGFISDKLLEFIEYDEKFTHFKGIAAEVRHNGVISYDKVKTALQKAMEQQRFLSIYEQADSQAEPNDTEKVSNHTLDAYAIYQNAQDAMEYLWALLDLSTADNMALHIGKQLIEKEERYFQLHLDTNKSMAITQSIPDSPTFQPLQALLLTVSLLADEVEIRNILSLSRINPEVLKEPYYFSNDQFVIDAQPVQEVLGNHNHLILILENLIKNALFFSSKSKPSQKSDRIVICLNPLEQESCFTIYNRGPNIQENDIEKIFDLGFSTRQNRQHHGKGLGLFFTRQIIEGYQGSVQVENIQFQSADLELAIQYQDSVGTPIKLETTKNKQNNKIEIFGDNKDKAEETLQFQLHEMPIQIGLTCNNQNDTFEVNKELASQSWLYRDKLNIPLFQLSLNQKKRETTLLIKPLDCSGVRFSFSLPTAESLLDAE